MSLIERCSYQLAIPTSSLIFREEWERCKSCNYDPENNKKCANYSPTSYFLNDKKIEPFIPESLKLNSSTLPILQN